VTTIISFHFSSLLHTLLFSLSFNLSLSLHACRHQCPPTLFCTLQIHPLTAAGLVPKDAFLTINAVSGYSGGGKALMEIYESKEAKCEPWGAYGFNLNHKHVPEMTK
jgi:hypothetical protein